MELQQALDDYTRTDILTLEMREVLRHNWVINGIWPAKISGWASYLLERIKKLIIKEWKEDFEADADIHDLWYYIWWKEEDRKIVDQWFFYRLQKDILKLDLWWLKEYYYISLSHLSYRMVRKYGYKHFTYK